MTSRTQQRRTSTPNSPPVGLVPGELAVEMADPLRLWVGVPVTIDPTARRLLVDGAPGNMKAYVDNANAAQDAVIATKAPIVYVDAENDAQDAIINTKADKTYVDSQDALKVSKTGDSMSGPLVVVTPPTAPAHAASKAYVDAQVGSIPPFPEAPSDGFTYGRRNAAWSKALTEAPSDANAYGRKAGAWVDVAEEAPIDGLGYSRKNGAWAVSTGGAYTDDNPPPGPLVDGQLWFRSTYGSLYCYYDDGNSQQWVMTGSSPQMVDQNYRRKTANRYNMVINGALNVSQENGNTEGTTNAYYAADQFYMGFSATSAAVGFSRIAKANPSGSQYRLQFRVTTAKAALAASDLGGFLTRIEGLNAQDLGWANAASQKDALLTFGFNGPAGTYCVAVRNNPASVTHAFLAAFTITAGQANTDTVQTIKVPAPTGMTTWAVDNTVAVEVWITFAAGSTYLAAAGWQTSNLVGVTGMSNGLAAVQSFQVWDIGLYADPDKTGLAPPFEIEDYATTLAKCMRYYERTYQYSETYYLIANGGGVVSHAWAVPKRNTPTSAFIFNNNINTAVPTISGLTTTGWTVTSVKDATSGMASYAVQIAANARM